MNSPFFRKCEPIKVAKLQSCICGERHWDFSMRILDFTHNVNKKELPHLLNRTNEQLNNFRFCVRLNFYYYIYIIIYIYNNKSIRTFFSHKTVQLFVRSLRGYTKSFLYWKGWLALPGTVDFFPEMVDSFPKKLTAYRSAVSILQTICIWNV